MTRSSLKRRLVSGEPVVGMLLAYNAPWLIEVCGLAGYDFVVLDLEHEAFSDESVPTLIRTADAVGLPLLVRMHSGDRVVPFLNAGASGVQIPHLRSRAHAEAIVELIRFPPIGRRTYYMQTRSARYGMGIDEASLVENTNEDLLLIGMLEDIELIEQLDDLLTVEGLDGFHLGPLDLAQSMGRPPPEELEAVIAEVVRSCRAAGKFVGVGVVTPWGIDGVSKRIDQGVQLVIVASAWLLTTAIAEFLSAVRGRFPEGETLHRSVPPIAQNPYLGSRGGTP
jgi:4-hydroxy-2-oxoheptanedioate aldolase